MNKLLNHLLNKKIGIWGFGITGKSILNFLNQIKCDIEILDKNKIDINTIENNKQNSLKFTQETTTNSIIDFLSNNDFIIASPGIKLNNYYTQFSNKFFTELDLFQAINSKQTIAITGSLGKTTTTTLLTQILNNFEIKTKAAGNIGFPLLSTISEKNISQLVLELSSAQLQFSKNFNTNIAIITNFYPNHLDYHNNLDEYLNSKLQLLKNQTSNDFCIIPFSLLNKIKQKKITLNSNIYCFSNSEKQTDFPIFFIHKNNFIFKKNNIKIIIFKNITQLPNYTYIENWLIIFSILKIKNISITNELLNFLKNIKIPSHRCELIGKNKEFSFYNDSKSTIAEATLAAIKKINAPLTLFLGGCKKNISRTKFIKNLYKFSKNNNTEIFLLAFGAEANEISNIATKYFIKCKNFTNLENAFNFCINSENRIPKTILFSPGGSSFDLFNNYIERGEKFTELVNKFCKTTPCIN